MSFVGNISPDIHSFAEDTFTQLRIPFHDPTLQYPDLPDVCIVLTSSSGFIVSFFTGLGFSISSAKSFSH